MSTISYGDAKPRVQDYVYNGSQANFASPNGNRSKVFYFTRRQLFDLVGSSSTSNIFVMPCLELISGSSNKYMNLICARVDNDEIDVNVMIVSDEDPYTGSFTFNTNDAVNPDGKKVNAAEFAQMQNNYLNNSEDKPLDLGNDAKVKGYNISREKLQDLGLLTAPNSSNANDIFGLILVIRPVDSETTKPYLSVALAQVDANVAVGNIVEYVFTCPDKCSMYTEKFL